jgi:hypothetical protein
MTINERKKNIGSGVPYIDHLLDKNSINIE